MYLAQLSYCSSRIILRLPILSGIDSPSWTSSGVRSSIITCKWALVRNLTTSAHIMATVCTKARFQSLSCRSEKRVAFRKQFQSAGSSTGSRPKDSNFAVMSIFASFVAGTASQFVLNSIVFAVFANISLELLIKWQNGERNIITRQSVSGWY